MLRIMRQEWIDETKPSRREKPGDIATIDVDELEVLESREEGGTLQVEYD